MHCPSKIHFINYDRDNQDLKKYGYDGGFCPPGNFLVRVSEGGGGLVGLYLGWGRGDFVPRDYVHTPKWNARSANAPLQKEYSSTYQKYHAD